MDEERNNLSKNQKLALAGLIVFGVFIVGLWVFNLNMQIKKPLAYKSSESKSQNVAAASSDEEKQKTQDTDGDGLSDWDELNVYKTSPYIADSDSDGIPDGVEVKNGTNPNCPQGKDCSSAVIATPSSEAAASTSAASSVGNSATGLLAGENDAASLRKMLLDAGLDKATLDQVSDEALLGVYKEMVASSTK